jgi:hypothetical protein
LKANVCVPVPTVRTPRFPEINPLNVLFAPCNGINVNVDTVPELFVTNPDPCNPAIFRLCPFKSNVPES